MAPTPSLKDFFIFLARRDKLAAVLGRQSQTELVVVGEGDKNTCFLAYPGIRTLTSAAFLGEMAVPAAQTGNTLGPDFEIEIKGLTPFTTRTTILAPWTLEELEDHFLHA